MAQRKLSEVVPIGADTLEELTSQAIRVGSANLVVTSQRPSPRVLAAITKTIRPIVLVLDDPRLALHHLVVHRGVSFADAVRAVACSCASARGAVGIKDALILDSSRHGNDLFATSAAIAYHLKLDLSDVELREIVSQFDDLPVSADIDRANQWWEGLDESSVRISEGALGSYIAALDGEPIGEFAWERDFFLRKVITAHPYPRSMP
jgi:hypothetical protein